MRIYLDNCCFNRPYDAQNSFRVSLETQAKLYIQEKVRQGLYDLVCSYMLDYENSKNKDVMKRISIKSYQDKFCRYYVPFERVEYLRDKIKEIMSYGLFMSPVQFLLNAIIF